MVKSECATQECTLAGVGLGVAVDVVDVAADAPEALLLHGIRPGARVAVETDAPFGGPRIVRIGGCRVAIDRGLTKAIRVRVAAHVEPAASTER